MVPFMLTKHVDILPDVIMGTIQPQMLWMVVSHAAWQTFAQEPRVQVPLTPRAALFSPTLIMVIN